MSQTNGRLKDRRLINGPLSPTSLTPFIFSLFNLFLSSSFSFRHSRLIIHPFYLTPSLLERVTNAPSTDPPPLCPGGEGGKKTDGLFPSGVH